MVARKALVTGATGGLGRSLVPDLIQRGYDVQALGRNLDVGKILSKAGARFVPCDLTEPFNSAQMKGVDVVFHLAALSSPWGKKQDFEAINVAATQALVRAAKEQNINCFIYSSTPSIYAASYERLDIKETDLPAAPFANHYAETKFKGEQIILNEKSFHRIIVRPRAIVGPHDTALLPRFMAALKRPIFPLPNRGRALIELTDVRDVVAALIAADDHRVAADGQTFNISGGQPLELREILTILADTLGINIRTANVPAAVLAGLSHILQFGATMWPGYPEPPLTSYMVKTLAFSQTFDLSKAKEVLNWSPQYGPNVAIEAALEGWTS